MSAADLFELLARTTWKTLEYTNRRRISFGEDGITSVNLTALTSLPNSVVVEDTRVDESSKGCDYELWIGHESSGWSRYAVQAKKISVSSGYYRNLRHLVGGQAQVDILEKYATANRAAGIYCFYNYSRSRHAWNCSLPRDSEQLGCSVTPLHVVRECLRRRGARTFLWIHLRPETIPWRCLVRCPGFLSSPAQASHQGWPLRDSYYYKRLPPAIRRLRENQTFETLSKLGESLEPEMPTLRPRRIGIIEAKPHDDPGRTS